MMMPCKYPVSFYGTLSSRYIRDSRIPGIFQEILPAISVTGAFAWKTFPRFRSLPGKYAPAK